MLREQGDTKFLNIVHLTRKIKHPWNDCSGIFGA
jgi:hypothetical protein